MTQKPSVEVEIVTLRDHQSRHPPPSGSKCNLFAFARTAGTVSPVTRGRPLPTTEWSVPASTAGEVPFTLVGIAEERRAARTVRSAILSSPHLLQFVHEGDAVEGGYRAGAITSDAVELQTDDGRSFVLRLQ